MQDIRDPIHLLRYMLTAF